MAGKNNRGFWERAAFLYDRAMKGDSAVYDTIARRAVPYLGKNKNVLELACGTGLLSSRLAGHAHVYEATDFSPKMIARAKRGGGPVSLHYMVQDATALPYAEGSFDVVLISNALHIMPDPEKALSEIRRVLRDDGVLIAPNFVQETGTRRFTRTVLASVAGFRVYSKWSASAYEAFLRKNGFIVIEAERITNGVKPSCLFAAARKATGNEE